jgi:hypothetical protein
MPTTARAHVLTVLAAVAAAAASALGGAASPASAATPHGKVHPGVTVTVAHNSCEAGFLVHQGRHVYIAVPASCVGTDGGTASDGCAEAQDPQGTTATITGAKHHGRLVYSSFTTMALRGTTNPNTCRGNNLALIRLAPSDARRASPAVPGIATPKGSIHRGPANGSHLQTLIGSTKTAATAGATTGAGWQHAVMVSGEVSAADIGAPVLTPGGLAVGMLTVLPTPLSLEDSGVMDLHRELRFLHGVHGFHHATLFRR